MSMQQILCWRLYMEDFDITLCYIEGEKNELADCFSRLPQMSKPSMGDKEIEMIMKKKGTLVDFKALETPKLSDDVNEIYLTMTNRKDFNFEYSDVYEPKEQPTLFPGMCENHICELLQ